MNYPQMRFVQDATPGNDEQGYSQALLGVDGEWRGMEVHALDLERAVIDAEAGTATLGDRAASWMSRPRALGEFLGYPADAIAAYEADACSETGAWTDPIPAAELASRVAPLIYQLYDEPPLLPATILDAVLPYTPPQPSFGTSSEHLDRAIRYLEAGVRAEEYGIKALRERLADHQRR